VLENVFSSLLCSGISDISISDSGTSTITRWVRLADNDSVATAWGATLDVTASGLLTNKI
jgi:hypothetical protein